MNCDIPHPNFVPKSVLGQVQQVTVNGVSRVGHDLASKPPPPQENRISEIYLSTERIRYWLAYLWGMANPKICSMFHQPGDPGKLIDNSSLNSNTMMP